MIGVDYNLFWELTPKELEPFKKAFELSNTLRDINNWELGRYIRLAVASSLSSKAKYPSTPLHYNGTRFDTPNWSEEERIQWIKHKMIKRANYINPILEKRMATSRSQGGEIESEQ